jgi:3-oxoacyl-(acyl-carrier-protein) synthase
VGGAEELSEMQYGCYDAVGALNKTRVRGGDRICPFLGGGLVLGEGAAVLIMEKEDAARKRGARIYGRLASGVLKGSTTAMGHYESDQFNTADAMGAAMDAAGLTRDEIDHVHVSANFSRELDPLEYEQLARVFPERMDALSVTPLKYLTGDFGGAGALRAASILLSLHHRVALPVVSVETLRRQGDQEIKWTFPAGGRPGAALMTTTTFGGGTASFVFTRD